MFGFIVGTSKEWIHLVKGRGWMLERVQDDSAVYIVKQCFIVLGFVREPAIINKDILRPLTTRGFIRDTNRW
jgi:hypothetical protein